MRVRLPELDLSSRSRPLLMGVLNVTPDSFSDGGEWFEPQAAIEHGHQLVADGADLIDVGGESTRPGASRPPVAAELDRVLPVIEALAAAGVPTSIDTMRAAVAERAVAAGAILVNDVSGALADPAMAEFVASAEVPFVVMHWRGHSADMQARASYGDVVREVRDELAGRVEDLTARGIPPHRLIIDPGLGFAKRPEHNWALLRGLDELRTLGLPLLLGTSRKAFLARAGQSAEQLPKSPLERDVATAVTSFYAAGRGVWGLRVHDIASSATAVDVAMDLSQGRR